jgi:transposase-like protein
VRKAGIGAEVPLETYARLQSPDAMPRAVLWRMVRGVSTRDYAGVGDLSRDGFGVARSSVSRDFIRASAADVRALAERLFDGQRSPVVMIDGVEYAGATLIVALGTTEDGTKRILGIRQGATENARSAWRSWRTCMRAAWTPPGRPSWCTTARRPFTRRWGGSEARTP